MVDDNEIFVEEEKDKRKLREQGLELTEAAVLNKGSAGEVVEILLRRGPAGPQLGPHTPVLSLAEPKAGRAFGARYTLPRQLADKG